MRAAQRDMLSKAEAVQPTVAVMEPNWNAMIASQKMQVDTLGDIMEKMETLTTKEELGNAFPCRRERPGSAVLSIRANHNLK